ncbi:MAG: hypothetical protein A2V45_09720 [Candidatus Aminicenantes bacterium RBG_19FT_COMBO_58_17]|nr:MAG: hypothetical protein A2V45_09720 [Candidatus Aminicenantes bacterium RBG_19FT_COMBO_58_17]
MKGKPLFLFMFFLFSALLSSCFLLILQVPGFKVSRHSFEPSTVALVLLSALIFAILVAFWALYARAVSRLLARRESEVLEQDFLTYLPLLFLSLTPLTLRHYIGSADLGTRLTLFLFAIAVAIAYLKAVQISRWSETKAPFWQAWSRKFTALSTRKRVIVLFLGSLLAFNTGTFLLVADGVTFSGDEPHYLLIVHSLLRDGDFDLANNYEQRDYAGFMMFEGKIGAHVVPGAKPGSRYSFHSPGVAFLMLPFYALSALIKGRALVFFIRLGMSLWGAIFAVQVYLFARSEWQKDNLALKLWFLTSFTTPAFFYSFHVYPEIVVAALSLAVFRILRFSPTLTWKRAALCGLFLGSFFWFHALKYIALFIPLFLYGLWVLRKRPRTRLPLLSYLLAAAAVIFLYLQFQHALYGTYSLSTVSWAAQMTDTGEEFIRFAKTLLFKIPLPDRWETLAGYFLDQRDGLFFYAPIFFFALFGAVEMFRRKKGDFWLVLGLTAPYVLLSAFLTQRTGYAPQARPLVSVIWGLTICLGYFLIHNRKTILSYVFNFAAALSLLFVFLLLKSPRNLYQETTRGPHERGGGLFFSLSNLHFQLTDFLPSYIKSGEGAWLPNIIWPAILVLLIGTYVITKRRPITLKASTQTLLACTGVAVFFVWIVLYPRLVLRQPTPTALGLGKKVTFYSLSRSARMIDPGRFRLREDGRSYRFFLTTERQIEELRISLGSTQGGYDYSIGLFDEVLVRGRTIREIQELRLPELRRYRLGKQSFYTIILELGKGTEARTELHPYVFELTF